MCKVGAGGAAPARAGGVQLGPPLPPEVLRVRVLAVLCCDVRVCIRDGGVEVLCRSVARDGAPRFPRMDFATP